MKKRIFTELFIFLAVLLVSVLVGYWLTPDLHVPDDWNLPLPGEHATEHGIIASAFGRLWALFTVLLAAPLYFLIHLVRQIWLRFESIAVNILLCLSAILLLLILYYLGSFAGEPATEGWTVYPPLSAIPTTPEPGRSFDWIIASEIVVSLILMASMIVTMYKARTEKTDD